MHVEASLALGEARAKETARLAADGALGATELLRRHDEAASAFRAVLKVAADSNGAHLWLGLCLFQKGSVLHGMLRRRRAAIEEWTHASVAFEKALSLEPNPPQEYCYAGIASYMLAATSAGRGGDAHADRAAELLTRALEGARRGIAARSHWYLAALAERKRDSAGALEHWREALSLFGDESPVSREIRGRISALGGRRSAPPE
jgi:hypothetical protein